MVANVCLFVEQSRSGADRVPAEDLERQIEEVKARLKKLQCVDRELLLKHEKKKNLLASMRRAGEKHRLTAVKLEEKEKSFQAKLDSCEEQEKSLAEQLHQLNDENLNDMNEGCETKTEAVAEGIQDGEVSCVDAVGGIIEGTLGDGEHDFFEMADDLESKEDTVVVIEGAMEKAEEDQKAMAELNSGLGQLTLSPFEVEFPDEHSEV